LTGLASDVLVAQASVLLAGFAFASVADWREREVTDRLWQLMGGAGLLLGAVAVAAGGTLPLLLWVLIAAFALQHMFAWSLGPRLERYEDVLDLSLYVVAIVGVAICAAKFGLGPSGVPYPVIALLVTVLFARGLFEAGLLFGGADAKAVMVAGILIPLFASPLLFSPAALSLVTAILPFPINLLMDAALLSVTIPVAIAFRNVARGELRGVATFTGYSIPVSELPRRFVWVRNPMSPEGRAEEEEIETSEQDRQRRVRIAEELSAQGQDRVWVTPQVPYLILLSAGAVAALLAGNLVVDFISLF
jgi:archaeal preflagellin peptidase FlaK